MKLIDTNLLNRFWKKGVKPILMDIAGKLDVAKIINNLLTTEAGYALDARQGKVLQDQIDELNTGIFNGGILNASGKDVLATALSSPYGMSCILTASGTANLPNGGYTYSMGLVINRGGANPIVWIMLFSYSESKIAINRHFNNGWTGWREI